jgi:hypothetical protein
MLNKSSGKDFNITFLDFESGRCFSLKKARNVMISFMKWYLFHLNNKNDFKNINKA